MGNTLQKRMDSAASQAKKAVSDMTCVYRDFRKNHHKNGLLVRKKFAVKDVCYRKNQPDVEVFRFELAYDMEMYLLVLLLAGAVLWFVCSRRRCRRRKK